MPWNYLRRSWQSKQRLARYRSAEHFQAFGAYRFNYGLFGKKMETELSASQFVYQGTPITSHVNIEIEGTNDGLSNFVPSFVNGRGDLGRTEVFTQTDTLIRHRIRLTENASLRFPVQCSQSLR
jgi:hypothetical protein